MSKEVKNESGNNANSMLAEVDSWNDYKEKNPHKPYEQSEKYSAYFNRKTKHYDKLYKKWLSLSKNDEH